jgi:hypothetical protein
MTVKGSVTAVNPVLSSTLIARFEPTRDFYMFSMWGRIEPTCWFVDYPDKLPDAVYSGRAKVKNRVSIEVVTRNNASI